MRVKLSLYFIVISTIFVIGTFFWAFKVVYGLDLGQLTLEKQTTFDDEKYLVSITQETSFNDNKTYFQLEPYDCGGYTCEVHEYIAPPYTDNDKGYVLFMDTGEEIIIEATGKQKIYLDNIYVKENIASSTK